MQTDEPGIFAVDGKVAAGVVRALHPDLAEVRVSALALRVLGELMFHNGFSTRFAYCPKFCF